MFSNLMKKMVPEQSDSGNASGTFGQKLKQTLSSSLLTAQDKVNKMSPRPSLIPDTSYEPTMTQPMTQPSPPENIEKQTEASNQEKNEPNKSTNRARESSCRVCLKSFKQDDFSKKCFECKFRVCEDCASYSKMDSAEDLNHWRCSVCRRKMSSRICIPQDSTDSNLDVPVLEALQRRHSDVKLNTNNAAQIGLQPPRSPELRRHSDVSPASLKELTNLEKLKGGTRTGSTNETEWANLPISVEPPTRAGSRRQSIRVNRVSSFDDDIQKNAIANMNSEIELSLGLNPGQIPRRKSAYDVFGGISPNQLQKSSDGDKPTGSRRSSFRIPAQDDFEKDESPSPDNGPTLLIDDDRWVVGRRRGSQLPDISALRERGVLTNSPASTLLSVNPSVNPYQGPALEDLEAPKRQTSLDGEAIKIVIHDVDSGQLTTASKRRVILRRDPNEKAHRTRGFGMRVVGGKTGADGKLFAAIVWTVPGGPAEKGGLQQGDKILEWCGVSLVDRSFEEVCSIMSFSETNDIAELLVEHASDFRMSDFLEDNNTSQQQQQQQQQQPVPQNSLNNPVINVTQRKNSDVGLIAEFENNEKREPASPTRRKLPSVPKSKEQIAKEKQVQGRVQIQVWLHERELVVSLMAADDLALRDENLGYGFLPEAYAKIKIFPQSSGDNNSGQTEVSIPNGSPIWNATLSFDIESGANLNECKIEVTLWDLIPQSESIFLGECLVDVQKAFLDDRAVWYRLEDPKNLRSQTLARCQPACNSPYNLSPRGSATLNSDVSRFIRQNYSFQRSVSDDCDSIGESNSLLHPDHAWGGCSRRGSSQSETFEIETYQLGKDFSKSLPGSRRNSGVDKTDQEKKSGDCSPIVIPNITRRRSSCIRKDPDEILRSLKAVRGELGRTMSLSRAEEYGGEYRPARRRLSRIHRESLTNFNESFSHEGNIQESSVQLGPMQKKNNYYMSYSKFGDLLLEFKASRSVIELIIIGCRNLSSNYSEQPDTFVELMIKDAMNDKIRQKKKTNVQYQNINPNYNFSATFAMSDVYRRSLILTVWQKAAGFEKSIALGAVEIYFSKFNFESWNGSYPLYPAFSLGISPNYEP